MKRTVGYVLFIAVFLFVVSYGVFASDTAPYDPENSIVKIETDVGLGSGWHAGEGLIVTAAHVVKDNSFVIVTTTHGVHYLASVEYVDPARDVAFVRIPIDGSGPTATRYSCMKTSPGAPIIAVGHALGLALTYTQGVIASAVFQWDGPVQFADITLAPGMSGGPVFSAGVVIGIVQGHPNVAPSLGIIVPMTAICPSMPVAIS